MPSPHLTPQEVDRLIPAKFQPYQIQYWCARLGVDSQELRRIIDVVGPTHHALAMTAKYAKSHQKSRTQWYQLRHADTR